MREKDDGVITFFEVWFDGNTLNIHWERTPNDPDYITTYNMATIDLTRVISVEYSGHESFYKFYPLTIRCSRPCVSTQTSSVNGLEEYDSTFWNGRIYLNDKVVAGRLSNAFAHLLTFMPPVEADPFD